MGGQRAHGATPGVQLLRRAGRIGQQDIAQRDHGFVVPGHAPGQDGHTLAFAREIFPLASPYSETGQIRGDRGHAISRAFMRGISPGLVPGGKDTHIAGGKHFKIRHVEKAVVSVQHGGHKDHLHMIVLPVAHVQALAGVENGIVGGVVHMMTGDESGFGQRGVRNRAGFAADGAVIGAGVSAHDQTQGQNMGFGFLQNLAHGAQGIQENIHALVVKFVAA